MGGRYDGRALTPGCSGRPGSRWRSGRSGRKVINELGVDPKVKSDDSGRNWQQRQKDLPALAPVVPGQVVGEVDDKDRSEAEDDH